MLRSSSEHLLGSRWPLLDRLLRPLAARWIAAGMGGCDARIELTGSP
ncbi:hypothetical protein [Inhella sp.]